MNQSQGISSSSLPEQLFPAPSLKRAGKDAKQHSDFTGSSKQVTDSYNLARCLPDGRSSTNTQSSFAKIKPEQVSSSPVYELWIESAFVAVSRNLKDFHRFTSRASPFHKKEVGEFYEFRAPSGEWVEIKKINNTITKEKYERSNTNK